MVNIIHFNKTGGPEVQEIEQTTVMAPISGEVQIRVKAIGLNRSDLIFRSGMHPHQPVMPACNGSEAVGIIESLGPRLSDFVIGEAVTMVPHMDPNKGTYCELITLPANLVMKSSPYLTAVESAGFWASYLTAYGGMIEVGQLGAGDTVVIPAASSSVGLAAIQIANMVGATPIAISRDPNKAERLKNAGAAQVLISGKDDLGQCVLDVTHGQGAKVVFDPVGGNQTFALAEGMAKNGIYVLFGVLSGEMTPFPVAAAFEKLITMSVFRLDYANQLNTLAAGKAFLDDGLSQGLLKPVIDRVFDFNDVVAAHTYMESNQHFGKVALTL